MSIIPNTVTFVNQRPDMNITHLGPPEIYAFETEVREHEAGLLGSWARDVIAQYLQCKFILCLFMGEAAKDPSLDLFLQPLEEGSEAHLAALSLCDYFHLIYSHSGLKTLLRIICTVCSNEYFPEEVCNQARKFEPHFRRVLHKNVFVVKALLEHAFQLHCMPGSMRTLYINNHHQPWDGEDQVRIRDAIRLDFQNWNN